MNTIHGYHDKNSRVAGVWNIIECVSLSGSSEATGIEGTEFLLTESGDVDWKLKEGGQNLPLFECQMYELYTYQNLQCYGNRTLIRFVGYKGHIIEFRLDQPVMSQDLMLLTYDGWFMLQCEKLPSPKCKPYLPYSLLSALQDGFFTDIKITSKSKKEFPCHSIILQVSLPSLDWQSQTDDPLQLFSELEDDVVEALLHFLYSRALPDSLLLSTARRCITSTEHLSDLEDFRNGCLIYGRNNCFRNHFIQIVYTVHESLENILRVFSSPTFSSSPSQAIYNLKVVFKHLALGIVKVLEACMEFEKASEILVLSEQRELMKYVRIHVPLLLNRLIDILRCIKNTLVSMTMHTRQELALQLVPEIHCAFLTIIYDVTTLRKSLEQIIQASSLSIEMAHSPQMLLANTLRHVFACYSFRNGCSTNDHLQVVQQLMERCSQYVRPLCMLIVDFENAFDSDLHLRELQKLRILQENLSSLTNSILCQKEQFEETESNARVRGVARMLELIADELPDLILRLQEFLHAIDDLFDWSEFQFVVKGATSKIRMILEKLCSHSEVIDALIHNLAEIVNDATFSDALAQLGFLRKAQKDDQTSSSQRKLKKKYPKHQSPSSASSSGLRADEIEKSEVLDGFSEISLEDGGSPRSSEDYYFKARELEEESSQSPPKDLPLSHTHFPAYPEEEGATIERGPDLFTVCELPEHLREEGNKLNLVKRVCALPAGHESKLASFLLSYLDSGQFVDMTFMVIPPPDEDECSNSSCESLSTESATKDSGCCKSRDDDHSLGSSDTSSRLESAGGGHSFTASRHVVRRVKKSFSLDRPSGGSPGRPFVLNTPSLNSNSSDDAASYGMERHPHNQQVGSSSFRQSLSLDAGSFLLGSGATEGGKRAFLLSANSDSCDSSATVDLESAPIKRSDDSVFESLSQPLESLEEQQQQQQQQARPDSRPVRVYHSVMEKVEARDGIELHAHRVVIAARCEWFKRALLSGMREAIDRHIEVPGVSLSVFKLFLVFLYGGQVDLITLQLDELVDLLVLVDHYGVDSLKTLIEQCLETKVDDDSAIPLMMVAYHCNATKLKDICLQFCALKRSYEMINQLPTELRQQLVSTISSLKKWHRHGLEEGLIEFTCGSDSIGDGGWDSPTSIDPLIDDESSSLLTGMHDSASSSEESFCLPSTKR